MIRASMPRICAALRILPLALFFVAVFSPRLFAASVQIAPAPKGASESGIMVTITTVTPHGLTAGQAIQISSVEAAGYNGSYSVDDIISPTKFNYFTSTTGLGPSGGGSVIFDANPGSLDTAFNPVVTSKNGFVAVTAVQPDENIIIAGNFTKIGAVSRNNIARITSGGSVDTTFNPGSGADGEILTAVVLPDGKILIGGNFKNYNGVAQGRIARLNPDGSLDTSFATGAGANNSVVCIARQPDGKILVGGTFTAFNGQTVGRLVRLQADGSMDTLASFNTGVGADGFINAIALQADGQILISGAFLNFNDAPSNRIARLNPDGSLEGSSFNVGTGPDADVYCIAVQPDNKILLGGNFKTFNGAGPSGIVRLNSDGTNDTNFVLSAGPTGSDFINCIALQTDGSIILVGLFNSISGEYHGSIVKLAPDGSVFPTLFFDPGAGTSDFIFSVAIDDIGNIILGGDFTTFNGNSRKGLARLANDAATQVLTPDFSILSWDRSGASAEVEQVTFELSLDFGATYTKLGNGTRTISGWELVGASIPANGLIRARGVTSGGYDNGVAGIIEQSVVYSLPNTQLNMNLASSNLTGFLNQPVTFSLFAGAPGNPTLNYTLDFGDGSPVLNGSIGNGQTLTFPHTYTASSNYTVTATVSDGSSTVNQMLTEIIPAPNSGGIGVTNVADMTPVVNPNNGISQTLIQSNGGLVQLSINVDNLTAAATRAAYFVNTDWGDVAGRRSIEPGTTPVHLYVHHGLFVAKSTALNRADGSFAGRARKTLTISVKETGETVGNLAPGRLLGDVSPTITTKTMKGKFIFNADKSDTVQYSGTIKIPSGLDTGKPHEFSIGIGNIIANTMLDTKGNGKSVDGSKLVKKLKVTYLKVKKGAITQGGEDAKIDAQFSLAGLVAAGFDTEGLTPQGLTPGSKTMANRTIQLAMLLDGVPYEAKVPVGFAISKASDFGTMVGRTGP